MKCPQCGLDMSNKSKCLRCGYTVKDIVLIDPEKIEKEEEPQEVRREINPDDVHVSRAGGNIFDSLFGGFFGGSMFGGLGGIFDSLFGEQEDSGYEYDPKYYDDFGNEIYVPDEFERESVEIDAKEISVEQEPHKRESHKEENNHRSMASDNEKNGNNASSLRDVVSGHVRNIRDKIHHKSNRKKRRN